MTPIRRGDGTGLNPKGFAEIRKGDGTVLWLASDIPDSEADGKLIHRWLYKDGEVSSGTVTDTVGSADGTVYGVSETPGDWVTGTAGDGDGTDEYVSTSWEPSSSWTSGDKAVAFSFSTTSTSSYYMGAGGTERFIIELGDIFSTGVSSGGLQVYLVDSGSNSIRVYTDNSYNDGDSHRAVINMPSLDPSEWQWYIDGSAVSTSVDIDQNPDNFNGIDDGLYHYDRHRDGDNDGYYTEGILDDVCIYDDSLTSDEATSYNSPWE